MTFSSATFLFLFLPVTFLLYRTMKSMRAKNALLTVVSVLFYAFGEPLYVVLLLLSAGVNYALALALARRRSRAVLAAAVVFNLALLGVFKYAGFAVRLLDLLPGVALPVPEIPLPIGISFYTFQILSYVIDVWRGDAEAQRSFPDLLLYISFFPQLIAGPIVKYHDIDTQIRRREESPEKCAAGIRRFLAGLSKKLLLANTCGQIADAAFGARTPGTALAWLGALAYCLQIYHDFSGYSDMAIGLGKMFGFDFAENFNSPYASGSIKEFWRRWHISLSTWFKEYLYIPLGGSRCGRARTYRNKLIVFFTTGLWHGASLNFIVWGLWHGFFSVLEDFVQPQKKKWLAPLWRPLTLFAVLIGFVFFRADSLADASAYLGAMFTAAPSGLALAGFLNGCDLSVAAAALVLSFPVVPALRRLAGERTASAVSYAGSAALFFACVTNLASSNFNPFIYFRF